MGDIGPEQAHYDVLPLDADTPVVVETLDLDPVEPEAEPVPAR